MSYYDVCPKKISECTIDDVYLYVFGNCSDLDRIMACFELRLRTLIDLVKKGLPTDYGHIHVINLAAFYYVKCLVITRGIPLNKAIQQIDFIYKNALSNNNLVSSIPLFTTLSINSLFELPPMSDRCRHALLKESTKLNNEIDNALITATSSSSSAFTTKQ